MFVRGLGVALACALAAVLAAGCSSGDKPAALPSLTQSNSASASPSPTSSATELAAVSAVVHRYFELINGPTTATAANELFAIMTAACKCRRVPTSVRDAAANGERYFGRTTIQSFVPTIDGPEDADVLVDYDSSTSGLRDASGRQLHRDPAMRGMTADFRLVQRKGVWLIDIVQIIRDGHPV